MGRTIFFDGIDPTTEKFSAERRFTQMTRLLGPPPQQLLERAGKDEYEFLAMVRKMLRWMPEERATARELLEEP